MFAVMWSEHCSYRPDSTCAGCPRGRARPRRTGGERRCGGRGGRDRGRHPHREPQPPVRHRALPGNGHRGRRDPRTSSPWVPPRRPHGRSGSARSTTPAAAGSPKAWCRGSPATATRWAFRPWGARWCSARPTRTTPWSTSSASGCSPPTASCSPGPPEREPRRAAGGQHRPGRHRWGQRARLVGLLRGRRGQAAERAGGRPLRGEAAHRGLPDLARRRPPGRHPGPRRRRPHVRYQRDGVPSRNRHGRGRDRRAPTGAGYGAVRGDDQRVPGAHARHRRAGRPRRGPRHLRAVGGQRRRRGPRHAGGGLRIRDGFDGEVLADVPAASLHEDAPVYDRPRKEPEDGEAGPARLRGRTQGLPGNTQRRSSPGWRTRRGSGPSTTTSCS